MESWGIILSGPGLDIMLQDVRVHASESYGMVTCLEVMDGEDSRGRQVTLTKGAQMLHGLATARIIPVCVELCHWAKSTDALAGSVKLAG